MSSIHILFPQQLYLINLSIFNLFLSKLIKLVCVKVQIF